MASNSGDEKARVAAGATGAFRLVTRSDFDGVVCGVLLSELGMIGDIKFVHPKDMQDGTILIAENDICTNLPYVKGVHLAFDHHSSEAARHGRLPENYIVDVDAPSAARVVYEHFGGRKAFPKVSDELMAAVDKGDSGQFSEPEIVNPSRWVLLNYLLDARTGLGRFRHFRISNYDLMRQLVDACRRQPVEDILANADVRERVALYREHDRPFRDQLRRCTITKGPVGIVDLRAENPIYVGNRFMVYVLFPDIRISIHVLRGLEGLNTVLAVGKSVLARGAGVNIGEMLLDYGGGGHVNAGTCQVENEDADRVLDDIVRRIGRAP